MAALRESKKILRNKIRSNLRALDTEVVAEQSEAVARALCGSEQYRRCASIGIFLSMPQGEIQTSSIIRQALADEKRGKSGIEGRLSIPPVLHYYIRTTLTRKCPPPPSSHQKPYN